MAASHPEPREQQGHGEKLLSIGQVLTRLAGAFPDLTPSKVRFLEEQGLVHPQRSASGYRKFSSADVERIRFVLALQRDRYLPLKIIKSYLDDVDAGLHPTLPGLVIAADAMATHSVPSFLSREDLLERTGATSALLADCVSFGLLPRATRYEPSAMKILAAVVELSRFGVEPRHLRSHRAMVEREAGLIQGVVGTAVARGDADSRARASAVAGELSEALTGLHTAMLQAEISHVAP